MQKAILALLAGIGIAALFSNRATTGAAKAPSASGSSEPLGAAPVGAQTRIIERHYIERKPRKKKTDSNSGNQSSTPPDGGTQQE